jgi:polysaccharide biosynthesis/export protein
MITTELKGTTGPIIRGMTMPKLPEIGLRAIRIASFALVLALAVEGIEAQGVLPDATSVRTSQDQTTLSQDRGIPYSDATIAAGDALSITVFDTPELSESVRVGESGEINLPLVGAIPVVGLTANQAADRIRERLILGKFLVDPQVSVNFIDFSSHAVVVLGEVLRPGPVALQSARRLWDVVAAAGGVTVAAGQRVTILHHGSSTDTETYNISWDKDIVGQPNPIIRLGDTLQVSRAGIVYVIGQVGRQGGYVIDHQQLSVAQVFALAGGIPFSAKAAHSRLIRQTPTGRTVTEIDVPSILKGNSPDIALQGSDIIYVPNSLAKVAISRGIEVAIGLATTVFVYRVTTNNQ